MAEPSSSASGPPRPKILEQLVETGKSAFDPSITDSAAKEAGVRSYNELVQSTPTWALLPALNTLIKPNMLPDWLKQPLMQTLTLLPLRQDGVRGTMEFVFSVHPSTTSQAGNAAPQKQGAAITHEAVAVATRLLSSVPVSMTALDWFQGISGQLFQLMDELDGPELARTAAQIVGFGILGKKQFGAPGAPGWAVFVQPLLDAINPTAKTERDIAATEDDEIIDLSQVRVLVRSDDLERSLKRLRMLAISNPSPGLCKRIIKPALVQIWVLASWYGQENGTTAPLRKAARELLEIYLRLFGTTDLITEIVPNLLSRGPRDQKAHLWEYRDTQQNGVAAVKRPAMVAGTADEIDWDRLQDKATLFVTLIVSNSSTANVSSTFLGLFQKWVQGAQNSTEISTVDAVPTQQAELALRDLIEVAILQKLMDRASDKLIGHFDQLLGLICHVFKADEQSRQSEDTMVVVLSLLNLVVTAPTFRKSDIEPGHVDIVERTLERLGDGSRPQVAQTATNIALLLKYRNDLEQDDESMVAPTARQLEDRRMYNLAMNYITTADNPPPVVSEGLNLLSGLIAAQSPILDVTAVNALLSNLLSNNEDYINLRVIKLFAQLATKHPKTTLRELTDQYLDQQERVQTDTRLRFGEALLQVIERLGETFTGEAATQTCEVLLSIAGRRGYRPKTMAKQARDKRQQKFKQKKEGGQHVEEEDDMNMDEDDRTEEEKSRDDILAQIVQGWDSKRGAEDVRMRSSALSIFMTALETNISGIGSSIVSNSIDLCISILALEPEMEKGILRRAAILVVLGFIKALERAKDTGHSLGFGLTDASREDILRTLQYVAATDNDGLVQQHARDVIDSLEAWQMRSLLGTKDETSRGGLGTLAGLSINPVSNISGTPGATSRPRIEEIE